jgi:hypothetical protein
MSAAGANKFLTKVGRILFLDEVARIFTDEVEQLPAPAL